MLRMQHPRVPHLLAAKRILRYIKGQLVVTMFIWDLLWFPGLPRNKVLLLDQVRRQNTGLLLTVLLKLFGYVIFFKIFTFQLQVFLNLGVKI